MMNQNPDKHTKEAEHKKASGVHLPHDHGRHDHLDHIENLLQHHDQFQDMAECFRYFGDPTRVRLFWLLCHMEECVVNLAALLQMSSPALSHHLRTLKDSGLIVSRREGKEVYYHASSSPQSILFHQMIEQFMEVACPDHDTGSISDNACLGRHSEIPCAEEATLAFPENHTSESAPEQHFSQLQSEQLGTIREIHDQLISHLDEHRSIDDLAKHYLMNPTTLKLLFKSVYGTSIAAHIKEHRMEEAAKRLRESSDSIAQIAESVGYTSQSKFTAAFKEFYGMLPRDYRKKRLDK